MNVCSGEPHIIADLATALAAAVGGPPPVLVGTPNELTGVSA